MREMKIHATRLSGLRRIEPFYSQDERGYFLKSYERDIFCAEGIIMQIHESFESYSEKGVLRGMHFQTKAPQAKLVSCLKGHIFDVAVDLRRKSPSFGQWQGFYLDDTEHTALYIPAGFAHGFLVLSQGARVSYQCDGAYLPGEDTGIIWNDADLGISWPLDLVENIRLSPRDQMLPTLQECIRLQALPEEET